MTSRSNFTIARVIARLNIGGPAIQAILMTDAFRKKGYRTILLTGKVAPSEGGMEDLALAKGCAPITLGAMSRRISWHKDLATLWQLMLIFHRERPVVVHTHTAKAGTLGRLAAIVNRVPVRVHTFHGHVFRGYFSPLVTRIFLTIERFLARHTDRIIAVSESQKRELADVYRIAPAEKISVVPLGFDLEPFLRVNGRVETLRNSLGCGTQTFLIGWVGRLTAIKDPGLFIGCAQQLLPRSQDLRFVLIGDGELRKHCEQQIEAAGLGVAVRLLGWQRCMERIYGDLDLLVLTSINEGTPVSLLEAMASGKAFVSTDAGGVRDLMVGPGRRQDGFEVFKNGILAPREVAVVARAVAYLMENPQLRFCMGQEGRRFVESRFSAQRLADDLESIYLSLARSKAGIQPEMQSLLRGESLQSPDCSQTQRQVS
jgi:glycosyltransferase involved in cell wall biosynthesis